MTDDVVRFAVAVRAAKAREPARGFGRRSALLLSAKEAQELGQQPAGLGLDADDGRGAPPKVGCTHVAVPMVHRLSQDETNF